MAAQSVFRRFPRPSKLFGLDHRINKAELMDSSTCTNEEMSGALWFLKQTNRYFGGTAVMLKHLKQFSRLWPADKTIHILDAGSGLADIPRAIALWAESKKIKVEITGLELIPQIAEIARKQTINFSNIHIEQRNIFDLDERNDSYDYVIASLFLHHIDPLDLPLLLQKLGCIAKRGIILSDLERSLLGYSAVSLLSALIGNRIVRHDGPLSVQRSFTLCEMQELADSNGLEYLRAKRESFFRISLTGEKKLN